MTFYCRLLALCFVIKEKSKFFRNDFLIYKYKKELILAGEPELAKKVMDIREENQIFEL